MKISLVIPNWNGAEKLQKNLPKVLEVARASGVYEVIISDDASSDKSLEALKSFPEVAILPSPFRKNTGFSSNVNRGVKKALGDFVILLNNDAILENDFLKYAMFHFENSQVFSVGLNAGGLWATAKFEKGFFWHSQGIVTKPGEDLEPHHTLWVSGGSGIFRKSIWDEMEGLDSLFDPFYVEDVDLGYRAWKRGYINIWEPRGKVVHYKEKGVIESNFSQTKITSTAERNILLLIWKNITSSKLTSDHQKALVKRLLLHPRYWFIFLSALKRLAALSSKRKIEQAAAKLTDEQVFQIFNPN